MQWKLAGALFAAGLGVLLSAEAVLGVAYPGPDSFGYRAQEIPYRLRNVSVTGVNVGLDNADDSVAITPIGFSFPFYGVNYTQVEISTNGFLSFTQTGNSACCSGQPIPTAGSINNFIAGWWEDLDPSEGGIIRRQTIGAVGTRQFVVGYYEVRDNDDPINSVNTMELILHEGSGNIELQYEQIQFEDVDSKVVGIENFDGTDGIEFLFLSSSAPFPNGHIVYENQGFLISRVPEPGTASMALMCALVGAVRCARYARGKRPGKPALTGVDVG